MEREYDTREVTESEERMRKIERFILLDSIDSKWKDHLYAMDYLRGAISWSGMAQKDPKVVYKIEGTKMFNDMMDSIKDDVTSKIFKMTLVEGETARNHYEGGEAKHQSFNIEAGSAMQRQMSAGVAASQQSEKARPIVKKDEKVGRNDPCPCGSGKKHKKCCGRNL